MVPIVASPPDEDPDWDRLPLRHRHRVEDRADAVYHAHKVSALRKKPREAHQTYSRRRRREVR